MRSSYSSSTARTRRRTSWSSRCATSMRKPSTPRSSQNRSVSSIASASSGLPQLRSGCAAVNSCRYHWPVRGSWVQAAPPRANAERSPSGGPPPGAPSRQMYQSRLGSSREEREASNHGWRSEEWFGTQSMITLMPRAWASPSRRSNVLERPEQRIDAGVVGDVVAEVGHRRGEEGRQPDRVHAERALAAVVQVVEAGDDPRQVADAVAVGVLEAARVDLVDDGAPPPAGLADAQSRPSPASFPPSAVATPGPAGALDADSRQEGQQPDAEGGLARDQAATGTEARKIASGRARASRRPPRPAPRICSRTCPLRTEWRIITQVSRLARPTTAA